MTDLCSNMWTPSSWTCKPIAQVRFCLVFKLMLIVFSRMLYTLINNIFQSKQNLLFSFLCFGPHLFSRVLAKLSKLPPLVTPSEVGLIILKKKATWISAEIEICLYTRSNVCAISSASFKATRPFCFTLVTALRASTLALTYVTSNYYITYTSSHLTPSLPFGLSL